jgi:hypothetical protein
MLVVLGGEKCREVMVKPPCDTGRGGILEIDDGVFVTGELILVKERSGPVNEAMVLIGGAGSDALAMETREERS